MYNNNIILKLLISIIVITPLTQYCINCNGLELKIYYRHYCTVFGRVVREAKKLYYNELITYSDNKVKMTYQIIRLRWLRKL
jgi:hypothetical protein